MRAGLAPPLLWLPSSYYEEGVGPPSGWSARAREGCWSGELVWEPGEAGGGGVLFCCPGCLGDFRDLIFPFSASTFEASGLGVEVGVIFLVLGQLGQRDALWFCSSPFSLGYNVCWFSFVFNDM